MFLFNHFLLAILEVFLFLASNQKIRYFAVSFVARAKEE